MEEDLELDVYAEIINIQSHLRFITSEFKNLSQLISKEDKEYCLNRMVKSAAKVDARAVSIIQLLKLESLRLDKSESWSKP
jgi:hypothetical protein